MSPSETAGSQCPNLKPCLECRVPVQCLLHPKHQGGCSCICDDCFTKLSIETGNTEVAP